MRVRRVESEQLMPIPKQRQPRRAGQRQPSRGQTYGKSHMPLLQLKGAVIAFFFLTAAVSA